MQYTELIKFRLLQMPCCGMQLCWVNPRLPTHCPECGTTILLQLRTKPELTLMLDEDARLILHR